LAAENLKRNVQNHSGVSKCELAGFPASVTRQFSEPNIGKCCAVRVDLFGFGQAPSCRARSIISGFRV
jgi:hypothetical protein